MVGRTLDWKRELGRFLKPFLDRFGHKARRQMCPLYVSGLIGPGDRKSIAPMAKRLGLGECDQLHHFIAAGSGMQCRWKQNCLFKRIGSLVAAMPCW
jgi:SRSO17 transposase